MNLSVSIFTRVTEQILLHSLLRFFSPVVDHFHVPVLLDPQVAHDNVVNATCRICPCVDFIVPAEQTNDPLC